MVHKKEEFLKLPKTYEATVVLGIESDTFDCLGIVSGFSPCEGGVPRECEARGCEYKQSPLRLAEPRHLPLTGEEVEQVLNSFIGTYSQTYPAYSSKTVNGKQLHEIARSHFAEPSRDRAPLILPTHMVTVENISNIHVQEISREELVQDVIPKIQAVNGDFRQGEIVRSWEELPHPVSFGNHPLLEGEGYIPTLLTISFTISVSGGTYIRAIADELGKKIGTGAVLWKLHRTKVGDYILSTK
jgi:tRNA pseudouridine(55) synthase